MIQPTLFDNLDPGATMPQAGEICRHELGLTVRVLGPAALATDRPRLRCEVLDLSLIHI